MSIHDKLVWVAIVSNAILWGAIGIFLVTVSLADTRIPEEADHQILTDEADEDAAPRHRA